MPEQVQQILNRILDWWRGMSVRQRVLLISAVGVFVVAVGIMIFVMTRPTWVTLFCPTGG